jgi:multiple sugar transport system substrate-binding protein/alpha-glucoside transport system substrate-binding protein
MRRITRTLPVLLALALAAAACGGDDDSGGGGSTTQAQNLKGQKIEVAAVWTGAEQQNFQQVLNGFTQKTGATVTYTPTGDNVSTYLGSKIEGGAPPDVAMLPQQGVLVQFANQGSLKKVNSDVEAAVDANFAPIWKNLASVEGTLYGVYYKVANKSTVWYRPQAFQDAGISDPPKTWDDFVQDAKTLSDSGVTPVSVGGADGWTLTDWFENVYLSQAGPDKYDQLSKHEIPWTDPSVTTALETLGQLWGDQKLIAGGASGSLQTDFPTSVTNVFGNSPKAAMVYEGDFVSGVITDSTESKLGTDALMFPFPAAGAQQAVVGGGDVAVIMKDTPASQAFLQYLASPEAAAIWAKLGGYSSANKNLDLSNYPDPIAKAIGEAVVKAADNVRFDMSDLAPAAFGGTVGKGEWKDLQNFLKNPSNVQGTAAQLEKDAKAAFQ